MELQTTTPHKVLEFEHYQLGVWQMIEWTGAWIDCEGRSEAQISARMSELVHNCKAAAARLPDGDDERFKIEAVRKLLNMLGYHWHPYDPHSAEDEFPF